MNNNKIIYSTPENIKIILNKVKISNARLNKINKIKSNNKDKVYFNIIEDIFIMTVIIKLSTSEISKVYGISIRTIEKWLKDIGLNRDLKTASKIKEKNKKGNKFIKNIINNNYPNKNKKEKKAWHIEKLCSIFTGEDIDIIKNFNKTKEDIENIKHIKNKCNNEWIKYIEYIYIFLKNDYSVSDISKRFNRGERTLQSLIKRCGLQRNRFEAQAIAKKKRNYKDISIKSRLTMLKRNYNIFGSKQECYTRELLNCMLPLYIKNCDIIVGLNNKSILDDGNELDIPIIIIKNNKTYKFCVEYDGYYWHKNNKNDLIKNESVKIKGYNLFRISPKKNATEKQIKECIENEILNNIIPTIKDILK